MSLRRIPAVPVNDNPVLFDKVIAQIQQTLKDELSWLDYSFGRAQKLVENREQREYIYPGVHIGNGEYVNVFPDDELGNFSFFMIEDPQRVDFNARSFNAISTKYSLIVWLNLDKIFAGEKDRDSEKIKAEVLEVLTRRIYMSYGRVTVEEIYEEAKNIYKGYSIREIDSQFLMQPYYGMRFEGEMLLTEIGEGCQ